MTREQLEQLEDEATDHLDVYEFETNFSDCPERRERLRGLFAWARSVIDAQPATCNEPDTATK